MNIVPVRGCTCLMVCMSVSILGLSCKGSLQCGERAMTDEQSVERALHWMMENSSKLAQSVANRKYLEDFKKVQISILFSQSPEDTVAAKEAWAYAHPDYRKVIEGLKVATEEEVELKHHFTTAEARIEVWRTMQANSRAGVV